MKTASTASKCSPRAMSSNVTRSGADAPRPPRRRRRRRHPRRRLRRRRAARRTRRRRARDAAAAARSGRRARDPRPRGAACGGARPRRRRRRRRFALSIVLEADRFVEGGGGRPRARSSRVAADGEAGGAADEDEGGRRLELGERGVEREEERVRADRDGGVVGRLRLPGALLLEVRRCSAAPRGAARRGAA